MVFVDTSALFAVLDADDRMHARAHESWLALLKVGAVLHTTSYVLVETVALLQNRIGLDAVRSFTADVLPILATVWVDEAVHRSAHHALLVAARRDLSLVDCVSFEVMRRLELDTAFCFDPHFADQGFRVTPEISAI